MQGGAVLEVLRLVGPLPHLGDFGARKGQRQRILRQELRGSRFIIYTSESVRFYCRIYDNTILLCILLLLGKHTNDKVW